MAKLTRKQDAFGRAIHDHLHGRGGYEICERDDGYVAVSSGPAAYLAEFKDWPAAQKRALRLVRGKVLDVGCGGGRVALHLQAQGFDATGIDNSPLAIKVCKRRGLKHAKVMSITQVSRKLGVFDTIVMYGNNLGLFGGFKHARWLLRRLRNMTTAQARIIAETRDPYVTAAHIHRAYHERNRQRGRMGGQLRLRIRYQTYATPWFDYLLASKPEVRAILDGTGWQLARSIDGRGGTWIAVIERQA